MALHIIPVQNTHLENAARLVSKHYQKLLDQVSCLPKRYAQADTCLPLLKNITDRSGGVVALEGGELKGFLAAWKMPSFRGKPSVFSPEWANAVTEPGGRHIYETMYTHLAAQWQAEGYLTHLISLFANDRQAIECWSWLGFGMLAVDATRDLLPVPEYPGNVDFRLAGLQDLEDVVALSDGLHDHITSSPTFLRQDRNWDRAYFETWIQDPSKVVWLALHGKRALAFIKIGPANDDACTINVDGKTASITGAFTVADARGDGIATGLLNKSLAWAHQHGYKRCGVDFEPMNPWARRFWLKYFQPVVYSLARQV